MITMEEVTKAYMKAYDNNRTEDCAELLFEAIKERALLNPPNLREIIEICDMY